MNYHVIVKYIKALSAHTVCLLITAFVLIVSAQTKQSDIGTFDFNKMQEAISGTVDTNAAGTVTSQKKQSESYVLVALRITIYLAIVILVIFCIAWVVKKAGIGSSSKIGGGGSMDILEVIQFGQNRNAMLVRVMDSVYLLGQTPNSIVMLEKIEGQKAIDLIASSKGGGSVMQFKDVFNNFVGKMKKPV